MTETPARKPRPRRTFSAFGDVRRMPSEYEIVTHAQNWTLRQNRAAAFEQNPSSAPNLWFLTYRDNTPLKAADWDAFRDPDALTYKAYVNLQADAETRVRGVLEAHAEDGADATLDPAAVALLGRLFTPSRYLCHGFQQVEAYIGYMAPSSYITNAAAFASADFLRRVTTVAYRTRELQIARPDSGIGSAERSLWEGHDGWQPARKAVEYALVSYDFGEAPTWPWLSARTTRTCSPSGSAAGPRGPTRQRWVSGRSWRPPPGFPRRRSPPTPEPPGSSSSTGCSRRPARAARRKPADDGDGTLARHDQP